MLTAGAGTAALPGHAEMGSTIGAARTSHHLVGGHSPPPASPGCPPLPGCLFACIRCNASGASWTRSPGTCGLVWLDTGFKAHTQCCVRPVSTPLSRCATFATRPFVRWRALVPMLWFHVSVGEHVCVDVFSHGIVCSPAQLGPLPCCGPCLPHTLLCGATDSRTTSAVPHPGSLRDKGGRVALPFGALEQQPAQRPLPLPRGASSSGFSLSQTSPLM